MLSIVGGKVGSFQCRNNLGLRSLYKSKRMETCEKRKTSKRNVKDLGFRNISPLSLFFI